MKNYLFTLLALLLGFVLYTLLSTGYFRSIENSTDFTVSWTIDIPGAEDFAISRKMVFY